MFGSELEFKAQHLCSQVVLGTSVNTATSCDVTDPVSSHTPHYIYYFLSSNKNFFFLFLNFTVQLLWSVHNFMKSNRI